MAGMLERYFAAILAGLGMALAWEEEGVVSEADFVEAGSEVQDQLESSRSRPNLAWDFRWTTC